MTSHAHRSNIKRRRLAAQRWIKEPPLRKQRKTLPQPLIYKVRDGGAVEVAQAQKGQAAS
jgi:hypothetical protein